jgi:hypothetical protein
MHKVFDLEKYVETASAGLSSGARMRSAMTTEWDLAPRCESPVFRAMTARPRPAGMKVWQSTIRSTEGRRELELNTRCRKCRPCLRIRAAYWRKRAESEISATKGRHWFVTLTLSPENHFRMELQASTRLASRAEELHKLDPDRQFAERHREICRELTLWLKRVRKASGVPLRYILVAEPHKSGLPHYHALIHEVDADRPVRAEVLKKNWKLGFMQCKLVAEGSERKNAAYVAKYLSKSASSRVRASQGYGHPDSKTASSHSSSKNERANLTLHYVPKGKTEMDDQCQR